MARGCNVDNFDANLMHDPIRQWLTKLVHRGHHNHFTLTLLPLFGTLRVRTTFSGQTEYTAAYDSTAFVLFY